MKWHILFFALALMVFANERRLPADIVKFIATGSAGEGLLAGNIDPATGEPGTGGIGLTGVTLDTDQQLLHVDLKWGSANGFVDLSADVLKLHLHGPTLSSGTGAFGEVAPLLITLSGSSAFDASRSSGGINADFFIDAADVPAFLDGRMYFNVHLTDTDTGVIRGYLQPVPEPRSLLMLGVMVGLGGLRRRR